MAKITITKIAYGSLSSSIGDGTIGYTTGVTDKAREVDGRYVDIPPKLSKEYSSLIWQYCKETDRYMLTHVQGSHVEDESMGRVFSYRGAYEVSRSELNRTGWSVANVMESMPRIKCYAESEVWSDETDYIRHKRVGNADVIEGLRHLITYAVDSGKKLYIKMPSAGRDLRGNGVFKTLEWNTLIEAIDTIDLAIRRYVSFAFCVDHNYAAYLDDVLVTVYPSEGTFTIPGGNMNISWEELKPIPTADRMVKDLTTIMKTMPGESERMLSLSEMTAKVQSLKACLAQARVKRHADFTADDYALWLLDGHSPAELKVESVADMDKVMLLIDGDEAARKVVIANHRQLFCASLQKQFKGCTKVTDIYHWVDSYKGFCDQSELSGIVATLEVKPHRVLIEELLTQLTRNATGKIIKAGLNASAARMAMELGTSVERWMTLMAALKDKDGRALIRLRTLCLTQVLEWSDADKQRFARDAQRYASEHPKMARSDRFQLMVKVLKSIMDKDIKIVNQPKSPSNNMQENNGKEYMAEGLGHDTVDIDALYDKLIKDQNKRKSQKTLICSVLSFIGGVVAASLIAYMLWARHQVAGAGVGDPLPVDSLQADSLRADSLLKDSLRMDSLRLDSLRQDSLLKLKNNKSKKNR